MLGATGSERIDLLVHDLVEHSEIAGDIVQGEQVGAAMSRLRSFMFERVYLSDATRAEQERARRAVTVAVRALPTAPGGDPGHHQLRPADTSHRLRGRNDRPLLHRRLRAARVGEAARRLAPWQASSRTSRSSASARPLTSSRWPAVTPTCASAATRWLGLCPFHDERTPSFSVDSSNNLYYCFGCQAGGDVFNFVEEKEGLDFRQAVEQLADRFGVELEYQSSGREDDERRRARERLYELLSKTAAFYQRYL